MSRIADTVVVAANDTKNNDNGTFLFSTEAQHGGKQRDGEIKQRAIAAAMAANKRLDEQEKGNK